MVPYVPCSDNQYFERLVKEAPYAQAWHLNTETMDDIPWLDRGLLEKSKPFFERHHQTLAASSGVMSGFGIPLKRVSVPFIFTGTLSNDADKTVRRAVKHVSHFVEWFHRGTLDDFVYKDLQKIKKVHNLLATRLQPYKQPEDDTVPDREQAEAYRSALIKDIAEMGFEDAFADLNTYNPEVHLSQFDMVLIQLDFLIPLVVPEYHLIEDLEGVAGLVHHWAVVGRLLGIEDRFNLALHPSKELLLRIGKNVLSCSGSMDLSLVRLMQAHFEGVTRYFHLPMSGAALYHVLIQLVFPDYQGRHTYQLMSITDKVGILGFSAGLRAVAYFQLLKSVVRYVAVSWCAKTSSVYHKLLKEDKIKLP